jgi:phosphocarrier protein
MSDHSRTIEIKNNLGLHARAASKLVQTAAKFPVEIQIGREDMMVNAKSIMGVLMLAACKGTQLQLVASGEDEPCAQALDAIEGLVDDLFGEGE